METLPAFLGTIGIALGIETLRFTWRRKPRMRFFITMGAWVIILGGIFLWSQVGGADWGVATATILFISVALILLGFNAWSAFRNRTKKPEPVTRTKAPQAFDETPLSVYAKRLSTFFLVAPIGGGVAIILTLSIFEWLQPFGFETANGIVAAFFLTPLLWTTIATWMVIDATIVRKTALLFSFAAMGALHLAWGD